MKQPPILRLAWALAAALLPIANAASPELPNILWITCEDTGPHLGCYGDTYAITPNLDRLAARGLRYRHVWSNAPVCAPARTTIISGVYPTATGSEHMRSLVPMPSFMRMYPQFLRERGYYCSNNSKEDYNLEKPGQVWDDSSARAHWRNRKPGQPFFAVFNIMATHESQIRTRPYAPKHDPAKVRVPGYHPDTPDTRLDWAQYYDRISEMDAEAGQRLQELADAGLEEDTIVFFYGDHGPGMPRCKRWPYNSGLQVPLLVSIPPKFRALAPTEYAPGGVSDRLVAFVDLAPTLLGLAGLKPAEWMQGRAFLGPFAAPPSRYLHGFRGRMDERLDLVRSVRDQRYVYIRNYMPHLIYGQYIQYMFQTPTTRTWKRLYDEGKLKPPQTFFWETKPPEEFYDLEADPDEVQNLAASPAHHAVLEELRRAQHDHALAIRDVGLLPEDEQHRRSAGRTAYELGHNAGGCPLEEILAMAELASSLKPEALSRLKAGLKADDSALRYWAAMGLLMRGATATRLAREELRGALVDRSPSVRVIAAWTLAQHGSAGDLELGLPVLKALAPPDKNGLYVSMLALNAIDALGSKAQPLMEAVAAMAPNDPSTPPRLSEYVPNLAKRILQPE